MDFNGKLYLMCKNNSNEHTKTRMTKFIKQSSNITEYHIISKLIFLRILIPKFMKIR